MFANLDTQPPYQATLVGESIAGLRSSDSGRIEVFGFGPLVDRAEVLSGLGVQLQESRLQDRVKVRKVVETFASFDREPLDVATLLPSPSGEDC